MKEMDFTKLFCGQLKNQGAMVIALVASEKQQVGLPDRIVIHQRFKRPIFIEFKGSTTRLGIHQKRMMAQINLRNPRTAFIIRSTVCGVLIEYCRFMPGNFNTAEVQVLGEEDTDIETVLDKLIYWTQH